jgi:hypothetical protein
MGRHDLYISVDDKRLEIRMHYSNLLTATLIRLFLFFLGLVQAAWHT